MAAPTALYDSCVLYPAPLRDLLMELALAGLFRARWSASIHEEWMRSVLARRPDLTRARLERTRRLMDAHVLDCLVTGYEGLIGGLTLPDPDDRHVLAAAIKAGADTIVTYNLRHFPAGALGPHGIVARHPDAFVSGLLDGSPEAVCAAARACRARLKAPPMTTDEYLGCLARQRLPRTVAMLRARASTL